MTTLNINDSKTENWSVSRSITDALWTLTAQIDKHTTPAFFTKIKAVAKDHNDTDRTPFVGIFPGSDYTMAPVANKATLTGYDYTWYLTTQYVPAADRTTLIDTDPAETVRTLLGGDANWATVTGVMPFRMIADVNWATIKKVFEFDEKCTRWQAIQEICEYCNYVFVVKPYYFVADWYSFAYFIPEADIDNASPTGLDLPAMQTFTKPDAYLMSGTTVRDNPEKGYNRIKVTGYDEATDTYYYSTDGASNTYETAGVTAGTELAIEYFYASKDLDSQAEVTARATALLNYFQASSKVYTSRLKRRLDLELYQKVRFADYDKIDGTTCVPVDMRITRISYHHAAVDDYVEIEFAKDQDAQQLKRLTQAVNPDYVRGERDIIEDSLTDVGVVDQFGVGSTGMWEKGTDIIRPLATGSTEDILEGRENRNITLRPNGTGILYLG